MELPSYAKPDFIATGETLALLFAERHASNLRYVPRLKGWIVLGPDGKWRPDNTGLALDLAGTLCRDVGAYLPVKDRIKIEATKTVTQIVYRSKTMRCMVGDELDIHVDRSRDPISQWISECCIVDPQVTTRIAVLYPAWQYWALPRGVTVGFKRELSANLISREGMVARKFRGTRVIRGIALKKHETITPTPHDQAIAA
jgi:hypothetical protein